MSEQKETQIEHSLSNADPPAATPTTSDTQPPTASNAPSEFKEPALERRHTLTGTGGPKPTGNLVVTVHQGKGVYNTAFTGVQNVYCMVRCGKFELQSKTIQKGGTDPVFEEKFQLQLNGSEKRFSLELYSSGMLFDGWIGRMTVRVEELPNLLGTRWHRIGRGDFDKYPAGEVMLSLELNGNKGDILSSMASTLFSGPSRKDSGSKQASPAAGNNNNTVSSLAISRGTPMLSISTNTPAASTATSTAPTAACDASSDASKPALPALPPPSTKASRIPEELMSPLWQQHQNEAGVPYYYNKITRQSVWELPEDGRIARH